MDRFEELKKFGKESIVIRDARLPDYDQVSVLEELEYRLHREARVFLIFAKAAVLTCSSALRLKRLALL
ncbi:hypothetical protein AALB52_20975 [Lachnospiraceae bacterium 38-14]|nr:hypothetical protein [Lachnospiraceae bacterium]